MTSADSRDALKATALAVLADAVLWVVWFAGLLFFVPRLEQVFRSLNVKLPPATVWLVGLARWLAAHVVLVPLLLLLILGIDGAVGYLLRRNPSTKRLAWLWWGVMIALPVLAVIASWMALGFFPLGGVYERLSLD
jgi:type II secretory pathway component PulF